MSNPKSKLIKTITTKESRKFSQWPNNVLSPMIPIKLPSAKIPDVTA